MSAFRLVAPFEPAGDQPGAIESILESFNGGDEAVTLLGATGTGKTRTLVHRLAALLRGEALTFLLPFLP